jgi:hypothetical protein
LTVLSSDLYNETWSCSLFFEGEKRDASAIRWLGVAVEFVRRDTDIDEWSIVAFTLYHGRFRSPFALS